MQRLSGHARWVEFCNTKEVSEWVVIQISLMSDFRALSRCGVRRNEDSSMLSMHETHDFMTGCKLSGDLRVSVL